MFGTPPPDPLAPARSAAAPAICELLDRDHDEALSAMFHAFYSLRTGKPVGRNFAKLIQVAQNVAEYHPRLMTGFGFAVKHFERAATLANQDQTGKWRDRVAGASAALARFDPAYRFTPGNLPLMRFLFPEIAAKVDAFWAKADTTPTVSA